MSPLPVGEFRPGQWAVVTTTVSSMHPVEVSGLTKGFGADPVLDDISLSVPEGTVYGLVGLNGAGKTTLLRLLLGLLKPDGGSVSVLGDDPWRHQSGLYRRMGVILEHDGFQGNLTVGENMRLFRAAKGLPGPDSEDAGGAPHKPAMVPEATRRVKFLSRGERMQCAVWRAFLGNPRVCVLDEPLVALDLDAYRHFAGLVRDARGRGATIIISSHALESVEELCDRIEVLRGGTLHPVARTEADTWFLRVRGEKAERIIRECIGDAAPDGGGWRLRLDEPEHQAPLLVSRLVAGGCDVHELYARKSSLREDLGRSLTK